MMKKYKAALFDLDGTLLDTLDDIADSMNAALKRMGFADHETSAFRYLTGDGVRSMAERSLPVPERNEGTIQACIREFRSEYGQRWANKTRIYPGISELLNDLVQAGIKLNILSNKLDTFTNLLARHFLARWEFSLVIGSRPDLPQKPDPSAALLISQELGIPPTQFVYLGDTGVDMRTAVSAGMFPVGALWGFRDETELLENGALAVIHRPAELLQILG